MVPETTVIGFDEEFIEFGSDKKVEEKKTEFEVIDEDEYEVKLVELSPIKTSTKNGKTTKYMTVKFNIREDVEQKFKNRKVWFTIFGREGDAAFNFNAINSIIVTQEGRKNYKRHFRSLDEILQYLIGLNLRLKVGVEFNQFKGKDDNIIVEDSFAPSIWDVEHPQTETPVETTKKPISKEEVFTDSNEDLPW